MNAKERKVWNRVEWFILNILMPLVPMAVRLIIIMCSKNLHTELKVIDVPELIYYTIFMCVITISMIRDCNRDTSLERIVFMVLFCIFAVSLIFIVIYYYNDWNIIVFWLSVAFSLVTTTFTIAYRFGVYEEEVIS